MSTFRRKNRDAPAREDLRRRLRIGLFSCIAVFLCAAAVALLAACHETTCIVCKLAHIVISDELRSAVTQQVLIWDGSALIILAPLTYVACDWAAKSLTRPLADKLQFISEFSDGAGHELATPIAILQSRLQVMERDLAQGGLDARHLRVLADATTRMANLLENLRQLSRTNATITGDEQIDLSVVKLDLVAREVLEQLRPQFEFRNIELIEHIESAILIGDQTGLQRMVHNLLHSAMVHGESGGKVELALTQERKFVQLVVIDTGAAAEREPPPENARPTDPHAVFAPRDSGGTWLGLSIAKAVADAHGGTLTREQHPQQGTKFIVRLPKHPHVNPLMRISGGGRTLG